MDGYPASTAVKISGILYSTLRHWADTGFIEPSVSLGRGKGSERLYSFSDLVMLKAAAKLRDAGIPLQQLRKVVYRLREMDLANPLAEARLVLVGDDVAVVQGDAELLSLVKRPGQTYLTALVNLDAVVAELRRSIAA